MKHEIIFFGNGMLAEYALAVLERERQVIFHARTREDLAGAVEIKKAHPGALGVLASFGVLIPSSVLEAFEPEGILNIHPSRLPLYRGASPIESAILDGANDFSVSVMKLVKAMDAGPIYHQTNITGAEIAAQTGALVDTATGLVLDKRAIYQVLAETGAEWILGHLDALPEPALQEGEPSFCGKFEKKDGILDPTLETGETILRKIVAFQGWPKPKFAFFGIPCTILEAHSPKQGETAGLILTGSDGAAVIIDRLQPEGRKAMDAKAFLNGYGKRTV